MTINSEEIVQMALSAFGEISIDKADTEKFELAIRRALMQREGLPTKINTHTYTITPGTLMGTWNGKTVLHG